MKRDAYVFDIDGTLATHTGIRNHYDYSRVHLDLPNKPVIELAKALTVKNEEMWSQTGSWGPELVVVSGRDDTCRSLTEEWLAKYLLLPDLLLMRLMDRESDLRHKRNDAVVKEELYHEYIEPVYNVLAVFDDRDRVVKMWRGLGLTCCQVQEGNF